METRAVQVSADDVARAETVRDSAQPRRFPEGTESPPRGRIGRYEIVEVLGAGAMGTVYRAVDPELRRDVAIKVHKLRPEAGAGELEERQRLLREGQALARVSHPNVVAAFDVGLFEGQIFVAMELIDGVTLREWLEQQPRTAREIVSRFVELAHGLGAAHRAGLVHRDVKPENAIVGDDDRVRVVDFGLAREDGACTDSSAPANAARLAPVTETGIVMGTPAYIAPEQLAGKRVGERSDQFSFCVSLWEALSGKLPFCGANLLERADEIDAGPPFTGGAKIQRRLRDVLERGMSADPEQRYPSMQSLVDAIARAQARWRRRLPVLAAVLALAVAATASVVAGGSEPPPARNLASILDDAESYHPHLGPRILNLATMVYGSTGQFDKAERAADRTIAIAARSGQPDLLVMAWVGKLQSNPTRSRADMDQVVASAREAVADLGGSRQRAIEYMIGVVQLARRDAGAAATTAGRLRTLATAAASKPGLANAAYLDARVAMLRGQYNIVDERAGEAFELWDQTLLSADAPERAELALLHGSALYRLGHHDRGLAKLAAGFALLGSLPGTTPELTIDALAAFAAERVEQQHWPEARAALAEIDRLTLELDAPPHMNDVVASVRAELAAASSK